MPLTFAHPAAVLPLMRAPLVPTALVAGALAPDMPYFLRALRIPVSAQSWWEPFLNPTTTHDWPGAVTVGLPLALVLYLALAFCARPAQWALPAGSSAEATRRAPRPLWLGWVVLSLVLGLLTHVVWDSFTHGDGWVVQNLATLRADAVGSLSWDRLLQHLSTAVGLIVLLVVAWRHRGTWLTSSDTARRVRFLRVMAVVLASAVAGMIAVASVRHEAGAGAEHLLSSAAIGAGLGAAGAAAGLSVLWWVVRPDKPRTK
ncbi:DUF4184 family protein [Georgenia sp. MJ173]|uniref:DUF4184 family protein n=1 Tax=Georgenia sunbinii TaxID=3117728 RepID=UPI002F2698AA